VRHFVEKREIKAIRASASLFRDIPACIPVEECAYHMQLAEGVMEADLAFLAEERSDSTVTPDWHLILASAPLVMKHQQARTFQVDNALNGPDKARRKRIRKEWEARNPERRAAIVERYRATKGREYQRIKARERRAAAKAGA
jgi:hypothetical protein